MIKLQFGKYVLFQVVFWIIAYNFLACITILLLKSHELILHINILANIGSASVLGTLQGLAVVLVERFSNNRFFIKQSLGVVIIFRSLLYFITTVIILAAFRYFVYEKVMRTLFHNAELSFDDDSWKYIFYMTLIYNFMMSLVVNFMEQVNRKFGPGMLLPLMLGKYRVPREENRVFLFMDLQSSTTIAEKLGHLQYSAMIRDCFLEINIIASKHNAQIYQYVGDEVVITWHANGTSNDFACIDFFFDCEARFHKRAAYYQQRYGFKPQFKAGAHMGNVTAVEIGEIKRDIAFHGDTLNTASRLQSLCNEYHQLMLISATLATHASRAPYQVTSLGNVQLKGKSIPTEIFSVLQNR